MPTRYSKLKKKGWGKYEGICPLCDKEGTHRWIKPPNLDFSGDFEDFAKSYFKWTKHSAKSGWKIALTGLRNGISAAFSPRAMIANELTADGIGGTLSCEHCAGHLMICSKCKAAYRYPTGANDFGCPSCGAKMFRM